MFLFPCNPLSTCCLFYNQNTAVTLIEWFLYAMCKKKYPSQESYYLSLCYSLLLSIHKGHFLGLASQRLLQVLYLFNLRVGFTFHCSREFILKFSCTKSIRASYLYSIGSISTMILYKWTILYSHFQEATTMYYR